MHIRAMDFEPFAFRINDNALPELIEGYRPESEETRKTGRGKVRPLQTYYRTTAPHSTGSGFRTERGIRLQGSGNRLIKSYMSVGVKLNHQKAVSLITMLRNKRMIVQENGSKYTFKPDFHY